jgi:polyphosphate glucokinase
VTARLIAALEPDEVVLGGGNVKQLKKLPPLCRAGDNNNAFIGGFRLWNPEAGEQRAPAPSPKDTKEIICHHKEEKTRRK